MQVAYAVTYKKLVGLIWAFLATLAFLKYVKYNIQTDKYIQLLFEAQAAIHYLLFLIAIII